MPGMKSLSVDLNRIAPGKARFTLKSLDALFRVSLFLFLRDGIGEGPFEGNEIGPANSDFAVHTPAAHAPRHVDRLGAADQHFLRIAAAQGTGSAERQMIDDGNGPSGRAHTKACYLRSCAATDDHEIIGFAAAHLRPRSLTLVSWHVVAMCR